jgi:tetratricopeptide (TPR) repeat protein
MLIRALLVLVLAFAPQDTPQQQARKGWEAIQTGDGERAASAFRAVLAANPRDVNALVGSGLAAHLLGRDDDAMSAFKRALDVRPDYAYAAYLLGQAAYSQGDLDLAIKSYEKVVKLSPGNPEIYKQLQDWKKEAALHDTFTSRPGVRFNVMFEGPAQQAIATRVSATLEAAYLKVGQAMNAYPPETVTAILYTREHFRDVTKSPSWAAGEYDGRIRIPVMGALNTPGELDRVVTHEYVHALIQQTTPRLPFWLNEGIATYFEPSDHTWLIRALRSAPDTIPLARLDQSFSTLEGPDVAVAYAESMVAAGVLVRRLGANFPVFLGYVSSGTSIDQALMLFNISPADVEREWKQRTRLR